MAAPVLQFKRGAFANLPGLRAGEPGFTTDKYDLYVGLTSNTATNQFFGSGRYWKREDTSNAAQIRLVDKDGSNYVAIAASDTLVGVATYRLPNTNNGSSGDFLKVKSVVGGYYDLEWSPVPSGSFTIAGDSGTDNFTTGQTLTFAGTANEINTIITDNQVQIGLPDNVIVGGALTATTGAVIDNVRIGISGSSEIDTSSGNLTIDSAGGKTIIDDHVDIYGDLDVSGNISLGGTTVTLRGTDVYIENKDIILGYTTSIIPDDDTANHAGVAIASTEGSPLCSFTGAGNTLPDTYKQLMWFQSGYLGFSTDAFGFNYGVAIGTTTMADGVRLAVGSGITMSDNSISATNGYFTSISASNITGSLTGTISTATRATLIDTENTTNNSDYYVTFVDTLGGQTSETLRVGLGLSVNPSNGDVKTTGKLSVGNPGDLTSYIKAGGGSDAMYLYSNGDVSFQQKVIVGGLRSSSNSNNTLTLNDLDASFARNLTIAGITTVGTGVGITQFSGSVSTGTSESSVPTSKAVIDYVAAQIAATDTDDDLSIAGNSGTGTVDLDTQSLTINGTANQTTTTASGQTISVALVSDVIVGSSLSAPTLKTGAIQSATGSASITIATDGKVSTTSDLTVAGNLYVNGSTTQVNTSELSVYDRTITLGVTTAGTTPTTTSWDLGILMNYGDAGVAKTSGVIWKYGNNDVERFQFASNTNNPSSGGDVNAPDITVGTFAPIEIGSLWVTDCAGTSQVISCTLNERFLENITVDAGTF